jgi:hypothetical protein
VARDLALLGVEASEDLVGTGQQDHLRQGEMVPAYAAGLVSTSSLLPLVVACHHPTQQ